MFVSCRLNRLDKRAACKFVYCKIEFLLLPSQWTRTPLSKLCPASWSMTLPCFCVNCLWALTAPLDWTDAISGPCLGTLPTTRYTTICPLSPSTPWIIPRVKYRWHCEFLRHILFRGLFQALPCFWACYAIICLPSPVIITLQAIATVTVPITITMINLHAAISVLGSYLVER